MNKVLKIEPYIGHLIFKVRKVIRWRKTFFSINYFFGEKVNSRTGARIAEGAHGGLQSHCAPGDRYHCPSPGCVPLPPGESKHLCSFSKPLRTSWENSPGRGWGFLPKDTGISYEVFWGTKINPLLTSQTFPRHPHTL